jgi:hypothetical protein
VARSDPAQGGAGGRAPPTPALVPHTSALGSRDVCRLGADREARSGGMGFFWVFLPRCYVSLLHLAVGRVPVLQSWVRMGEGRGRGRPEKFDGLRAVPSAVLEIGTALRSDGVGTLRARVAPGSVRFRLPSRTFGGAGRWVLETKASRTQLLPRGPVLRSRLCTGAGGDRVMACGVQGFGTLIWQDPNLGE